MPMDKYQKKNYEKPEIKSYGNIKKVTGASGDIGHDGSDQSS